MVVQLVWNRSTKILKRAGIDDNVITLDSLVYLKGETQEGVQYGYI